MGEGSGVAVSCGISCRHGSDLALLWLWCRLAATAPIRPLAGEPPCAVGADLEKAKRPKKKKKKEREREQEMVNKNETVANSINIPAFLSFSPSLITLYKVILGYMYIHICVYKYTYTNM